MSFADQYLSREKVGDNTDAVLKLISVMTAETSQLTLSEEQKRELKSMKDKCSYQTKPLIQIYREKLWQKWREYSDPVIDLKTAISNHEKNKKLTHVTEELKLKDASSSKGTILTYPREFSESVVEIENAQFVIEDGETSNEPIRYSKRIEWDDFSEKVHQNPYSGSIDLYRTMLDIMSECARVGCDRKQLCMVYKLFVYHHLKESWNSLAYEKDPETIFDILMGLLDIGGHLNKMRDCLKQVKRRPGEGIATPVRSYQSLIQEILSLQSPNSTDQENREQAIKEASKAVKFFVTKPVWLELGKYKELFKNKHHRFATMSEIFGFVNDMESNPENLPRGTLSLDNQDVRIDLFFTDTQRSWSAQFGRNNYPVGYDEEEDEFDTEEEEEVEVHTSEADYVNFPGSAYGSSSSTAPAVSPKPGETRHTRSQPTVHQTYHQWGDTVGSKKGKAATAKAKNAQTFPFKPPSRGLGRSRGPGSRSSGSSGRSRQSAQPRAGSGGRGTPRQSPAHSPSGGRSGGAAQGRGTPSHVSPSRMRSGSASSTESRSGRSRTPGRESRAGSASSTRSPSPGRCHRCWSYHPDGRCMYGKLPATPRMCTCKKGYHHQAICMSKPSASEIKRSSSKERKSAGKGAEKKKQPFMPHKSGLN